MTPGPIVIKDDGTGMTDAELRDNYLRIANDRFSRSKDARTNGKKRLVKGRKGIGKFAGLAAAKVMRVETSARGRTTSVTISKAALLDVQGRKDLEKVDLPIESVDALESVHGTVITLSELDDSRQFPLPDVLKRLLVREYQREEGFTVYVNGERLAVTDLGGKREVRRIDVPGIGPATITWTVADKPLPKNTAGFVFRVAGKVVGNPTFCGLEDEEEIPEKVRNRIFGEIEADGLDRHVTADWGNLVENSIPLQAIKAAVRHEASDHVREVCRSEVQLAKARLAKAYKARIETLPEHRRAFAVEAVEEVIAKYFPEGDEKVKVLVGLVLDALEKDEYYKVCENIAKALGSDIARIAECLEKFGLVDMAVMVQQARRRLTFLDSFETLVKNKDTLEKAVHQALEHNLWALGPQYSVIASNQTLKTIIETYCDTKFKGKRASKRPDLFLGHAVSGPKLLIEFKRPSASVGRDAETQAKKYRDDLTPSHGAMNVLVLGGSVDPGMSAHYETSDVQFRGYLSVIAEARTHLEWLLKELQVPERQ